MSDKRVLVDWLLDTFESRYKHEWQNERFSVLGDWEGVRHPHDDLDFFFFWKIYDQGWFAGQSEVVFDKLCRLAGGGSKMVRSMAAISPEHAEHLKSAFETESLPSEVQKAFTHVRGGWRVLGWAVKAAKKLCRLYGLEKKSYIAQWLANFMCNRQWTGHFEDLVHCINSEIEGEIGDLKSNWRTVPYATRRFLEERLLRSKAHLPGSGPETLSYFFRDWRDIILWKYMWKQDQKNQDFWHLAYQVLEPIGMGPTGEDMQAILDFLGSCLSPEEIESGALAKVNTAVYRLMSAHSSIAIETRLRNLGEGKR